MFVCTNCVLKIAVLSFTKRSNFSFLTFQKRKTLPKLGIVEMLPSWYILSLKPKGKFDCEHLIHFNSVSCI